MLEDASLELAQLGPGLYSELIDQLAARGAECGQRVRLPPRSVQGEHAGGVETLPQGMLAGELLELRDQFGVTSHRELGVNPPLDRPHAPLLQLAELAIDERFVHQIGESGAPPQRQRLPQQLRGARLVT